MKKTAIILMIAIGIFAVASTASAGEFELETYYNDYLTMKISQCDQTAHVFRVCYNTRMYELIQMRAAQAEFYENNRDVLVKAMILNKVGTRPDQIDYFLMTQFKNRNRLAHNN
ncbi:MAG: hypothetical protein K9K62_07855 [Desulfobacteraceae bacterium]|nr:hypothetical protein [Desulfobacteraceae bacterium]